MDSPSGLDGVGVVERGVTASDAPTRRLVDDFLLLPSFQDILCGSVGASCCGRGYYGEEKIRQGTMVRGNERPAFYVCWCAVLRGDGESV